MTMGAHIIDGEFQSDKYPTCPRGKVPLSVADRTAQDLLWEYAQRRRAVDAEFSADLETALRAAGYLPSEPTVDPNTVHYSEWAQQPDIRLACGRMTTPAWIQRDRLPERVYQTDDGDLYTFERKELVTCTACLATLDERDAVDAAVTKATAGYDPPMKRDAVAVIEWLASNLACARADADRSARMLDAVITARNTARLEVECLRLRRVHLETSGLFTPEQIAAMLEVKP
jgi:hypothetical protein